MNNLLLATALATGLGAQAMADPPDWYVFVPGSNTCEEAPVDGLPQTVSPQTLSDWLAANNVQAATINHPASDGSVILVEVKFTNDGVTTDILFMPNKWTCAAFKALYNRGESP